jgi:steroid delta-isomerase-like uncharacterized protein
MSQDNTALARRWFEEVWNQRRGELIDELIAREAVCQSPGGLLRGPEEFRTRVFVPFLAAFPDMHVSVVGMISQGDQVVVRWTATGTHRGDALGIPASGRTVFLRGMTWIRYAGGQMVEGWDCWDQRELIESLR